MAKEFFNSKEAAAFLDMTLDEFLRKISSGACPVKQKAKDPTLGYYREDLERWVADGKPKGQPGCPRWPS